MACCFFFITWWSKGYPMFTSRWLVDGWTTIFFGLSGQMLQNLYSTHPVMSNDLRCWPPSFSLPSSSFFVILRFSGSCLLTSPLFRGASLRVFENLVQTVRPLFRSLPNGTTFNRGDRLRSPAPLNPFSLPCFSNPCEAIGFLFPASNAVDEFLSTKVSGFVFF